MTPRFMSIRWNPLTKGKNMNNADTPTPPDHPSESGTRQPKSTSQVNLWKSRNLPIGEILITANADKQLSRSVMLIAIARHCSGDWGDVSEADWQANDEALEVGNRIHSAYRTADGVKFWIITEWDRSITTILLPDDY